MGTQYDLQHRAHREEIKTRLASILKERGATIAQARAAGAAPLTQGYFTHMLGQAAALLAIVDDFAGSPRKLFAVEVSAGKFELWATAIRRCGDRELRSIIDPGSGKGRLQTTGKRQGQRQRARVERMADSWRM